MNNLQPGLRLGPPGRPIATAGFHEASKCLNVGWLATPYRSGRTKPYEFIGFGAMEVTKPYEFLGFGAMEVTKPYEFIGVEVSQRGVACYSVQVRAVCTTLAVLKMIFIFFLGPGGPGGGSGLSFS